MLPAQLDAAISAVCPIAGVSLGSEADKSTWIIRFADHATDEQRARAHDVLTAFEYREQAPRDELQEQIDLIRWVAGAESLTTPAAPAAPFMPADLAALALPDESLADLKMRLLTELTRLRSMAVGRLDMTDAERAMLTTLEGQVAQQWFSS